jgi:hypothetical protein
MADWICTVDGKPGAHWMKGPDAGRTIRQAVRTARPELVGRRAGDPSARPGDAS